MKDIPRFSLTLRSSTELEVKFHLLLDKKRARKKELSSLTTETKEMLKELLENFPPEKQSQVNGELQKLRALVRSSMGYEEQSQVIEHATLFFFWLFLESRVMAVAAKMRIRNVFGATFEQGQLNRIHQTVIEIRALLEDYEIEALREYKRHKKEKPIELLVKNLEGWGEHIKIELLFSRKTARISELLNLSAPTKIKNSAAVGFSMKLKFPKTQKSDSSQRDNELSILLNDLNGSGNTQLISKVRDLLISKRSNNELQNDLIELLGFERFDLVKTLLEKRISISNQLTKYYEGEKKLQRIMMLQPNAQNTLSRAPTVASSVVVQSAREKELSKQSRREEKKLQRALQSQICENGDDIDNATIIDPMMLRVHQQRRRLETAQQEPLLKTTQQLKMDITSNRVNNKITKYPHVYDSALEARQHASFIGGNRLTLPDHVERVDNKMYEEVKIPAPEPQPLPVGNKHIHIAELDDIGKLVFSNCTKLNTIQSIVYNVAYHSNENMLVCAPTGAGKTNVAMLTIVQTIRSHVDENGTINRDDFKIIYIAPMKALVAEMVENFSKRLKCLNIQVRELTGDMQLTKTEMAQTQVIVTTPEKWDVVTRKASGDVNLIRIVKLLIIDEVHLLHGDRGPVVEALVARTLRMVESSQSMIRIIGLSATLPNYIDVAHFLRVNPMKGLFYFDHRFRPVPLDTNFVGIKSVKPLQQFADMDQVCYEKCVEMVKQGHQVMVFVHARNATVRTATTIRELSTQHNTNALFLPTDKSAGYDLAQRAIQKSRNKQLVELFSCGLAMHHAGMLRSDRQMVEKYFSEGYIKVLVSTATLAWGVNLPAHAVIIKGTDIYDSNRGSFVDLGILDVLQIFGRAGRPQFDTRGVGTIITTYDKLSHYLSLLTNKFPIESNFVQCLADNLNAEIASGTICNVEEAIEWLSYTYLIVRMRINPHVYGIEYAEIQNDPLLEKKRSALIIAAAMELDKARMIRFNQRTMDFSITDLGRTASHFYIKYDTIEIFNDLIKPFMNEGDIFAMISKAQEFEQLKVRDDELDELDDLRQNYCRIKVFGGSENVCGKVNILMQTFLSRGYVKSFSLVSDLSYIIQNVTRIARALFTIVLRNNNAVLTGRMLQICKMFERQQWDFDTPLRQFNPLNAEVIDKIESRGLNLYTILDMSLNDLKSILRNQRYAEMVMRFAHEIPMLDFEINLQPITRTVLRIKIDITPKFNWNDKFHGKVSQGFWIWIEDPETNFVYHSEMFQASRKFVLGCGTQQLVTTIPLKEPLPPQYYIRVASDTWLGSSTWVPLSFQQLILPEHHPPLTELLPLQPLPVTALKNLQYQSLYDFTHFNPIQTQIFHCIYHTNNNVLLGAPTGSGKTIVAEIAMFRALNENRNAKIVYIAPLKALVKERISDWKRRFQSHPLNLSVVELTGDTTPDIKIIQESQIIVTTPEKWDGISRSWQTREYVQHVELIVIDEIHLLGQDRGPVIEVIVSRTNFISSHTNQPIRIIGLSTALANAQDLANWLGITKMGLYNFKPSVRPVPLQVHINGFSGKHYCPRMATMNRPAYQAIRTYSPCEPVIVFVASRRQTRLTAMDLITFVAAEENSKQFLHIPEHEMQQILHNVKDVNLKMCLTFGIGLHHAGLQETDRKIVEELFYNRKIQILIATATLAWGINLPAHLVIIKGTEYFDGKVKKYVDMPITDVLQMMGRAGRPQFDNEGVAVVFVHDEKKNFYKKFLYDPFPVESSLLSVLSEHINAEIVAATIQTKQAALDYLTWTYFFRRLLQNPSYYELEAIEQMELNAYLSRLIENVIFNLQEAGCALQNEENYLVSTFLGRIASYYYLSPKTMKHFLDNLKSEMSTSDLIAAIADCNEFEEQPVRHNEDKYNEELAQTCRYQPPTASWDSPHTKTFLLLQAHFMRLTLPNSDYLTDTKSALDNVARVIQAMIDYTAERSWLSPTLKLQQLTQSVIQARWFDESDFLTLPHVNHSNMIFLYKIKHEKYSYLTLPALKELCCDYEILAAPLRCAFEENEIEHIHQVLQNMPSLAVEVSIQGRYFNDSDVNRNLFTKGTTNEWTEIHASEDYVLCVHLDRLRTSYESVYNSRHHSNSSGYPVYCPRFPKGKSEAWFLTLGSEAYNEVIAMKRVLIRSHRSIHRLRFQTPAKKGRMILTLFLMSDCLIGFDQQFHLQFDLI